MNIKNAVNATKFYIKNYGIYKTIKKIISKVINKIFRKQPINNIITEREKYQIWIKNNEPNEEELEDRKSVV